MSELKYEEINPRSRRELIIALASDDLEQIRNALYSAGKYESDWQWSQAQCLKFLVHADRLVRWAAALSLGYIALYQRRIDLAEVLPALHAAKEDAKEDDQLVSVVQDAIEMILHYIKRN